MLEFNEDYAVVLRDDCGYALGLIAGDDGIQLVGTLTECANFVMEHSTPYYDLKVVDLDSAYNEDRHNHLVGDES
jgi:hypothetical protein